jgi:hypothetical protein
MTITIGPSLSQFSILAQSGITSAAATTVNNGLYGNAGGHLQNTGVFTGTENNDPTLIGNANADLTTLVLSINALPFVTTSYSGGSSTFVPNVIYTSSGNIVPNGTLTFDALGNSNAQFFIVSAASKSITFIGNTVFNLTNGAQAKNIFWLANTSGLISTDNNAETIQGNLISGTSVTIGGVQTINGAIYAKGTNVTFAANTIVNGSVVCYLKGSKILTENGYVFVEDLAVGDKVVTKCKIINNEFFDLDEASSSLEPITWIGNFQAPNLNKDTLPICIQANAFGNNLPFEDLYVSSGHRIIIDDKMVCARDLVNGTTIFQDLDCISVHYYHFELNEHSCVIANGVLSESYLDINTRNIFVNTETTETTELQLSTPILA